MEILIDRPARDYIIAKGHSAVSLDAREWAGGVWGGGNCGTPRYPSVRPGKPAKPEIYEQTVVDGITVYYKPSLAALFGKITVKVEKLLFIKSLVAAGER